MSNQPSEALNPTLPGTVLAGKYRVERIIGQGGMGVVVEARHIALEERVALKFLLPDYATHPEASTRFLREARAAVKIKSEHVARVSDVGTLDTGAPYMVMEFLEGRDLRTVLEAEGVLGLADAVDYVIQGCEAIAEAHQHGIVHRDIKPANLFLTKRSNGSPLVKVLDFGISKMTGQGVDNLTKTTAAMGSALYMSPEQMQATRGVDHRTDIYALGISLYELLAGKQPFYADTLPALCAEVFTGVPVAIRTLRPDLPEAFAVALEKAYARDRVQRYQSVSELVVALAPFAPPRSRATIEGVARMGGLEAPAPSATAPDGTHVMSQAMPVPVVEAPASQAITGGGAPPTQPSPQAVSQSSASLVSVVTSPPAPRSKMPMLAALFGAVLAVSGLGAFFALRASSATPAGAAGPVETSAPQPPITSAPVVTATAAPVVTTAEPAVPAPSVTATATAVSDTTVAAAAPNKPTPGIKRPAVAAPAKTAAPAAQPKKPDVGF